MYQTIIRFTVQGLTQRERRGDFLREPVLIDRAVQIIRDLARENFRLWIDRKKPKSVLPMILQDRQAAGLYGLCAAVGDQFIVIDPGKPVPQALGIGFRL